ncbi:MAG: hypothetical protein ACLQF0_05625 [Dissulfurispiraceae bacterium]
MSISISDIQKAIQCSPLYARETAEEDAETILRAIANERVSYALIPVPEEGAL